MFYSWPPGRPSVRLSVCPSVPYKRKFVHLAPFTVFEQSILNVAQLLQTS